MIPLLVLPNTTETDGVTMTQTDEDAFEDPGAFKDDESGSNARLDVPRNLNLSAKSSVGDVSHEVSDGSSLKKPSILSKLIPFGRKDSAPVLRDTLGHQLKVRWIYLW